MVRYIVVGQLEEAERAVQQSAGSAKDTLVEFMHGYWARIRSPQFGSLFRLIHAELHKFPDLARFYADEVVARSKRLIAGIIQRGIESGEFRAIDPYLAARMLAAPFVMHGLWCEHRQFFGDMCPKSDEQVLDEMIQFYLYAITPRESAQSNDTP